MFGRIHAFVSTVIVFVCCGMNLLYNYDRYMASGQQLICKSKGLHKSIDVVQVALFFFISQPSCQPLCVPGN